ncbi:hypothetical protein GCM10010528_06960 [Gordonia defluvii]|jgi:hypothetical protein|uniref:Integral membrane protein n=1 Tax=Gordonia defluvii TaxID=283718 RepID=A0ABP6L1A6_9ACTN|nr:DUF6350 family protein [Gordonia sp. UBA5067]
MKGQSGSLAARLRQVRQNQREHARATAGTARELVIVAFAVPLVTLLVLALVVIATMAAAGTGFGAFGTALGSAWLCLHQVPLSVGGVSISALPLLPTIGLVVAVFVYTGPSARLRTTSADLGALVGAAVGGPMLITALALALVLDGSSVLPVNPPNALWAFAATALIYGGGTIAGIGRRDWRVWGERAGIRGERLDDLVAGVRAGALAALAMVGAAAALVCVLLLLNWPAVSRVVAGGNRVDGYLGLVVVSLLYLPNVVIDAVGVLVGTTVQLGGATVDLFNPQPGAVPALPILAILPGDPPIRYLWAIALVVPLAIACRAALRMRHYDLARNLRRVTVGAATTAAVLLIATVGAGGTIGELGRAGGDAPVVALAAFAWIMVVGAIAALGNGLRAETKAARAAALAGRQLDDAAHGAEAAVDADDSWDPATAVPTPAFYRPDDDAPVIDDVEDLMFVDDLPGD